jgi:hypothetical protein
MSLIFIAVPTSGVTTDGKLNAEFVAHVAGLHELYPQHTFIVPMIQDYALLPYLKVEATWEVWGHHCKALIKVCDEVWVMMYDGWGTSTGVRAEIDIAADWHKAIYYLPIGDAA